MPTIRESEDALFARWREGRDSFSPDGLADEDAYLASHTKIVFLLKEVNDPAQTDFDLRSFVKAGGRAQTWNMVARWVRGIRALEADLLDPLPWADHSSVASEDRARLLPAIGAVNLKKAAGGHTTNNDKLAAAVEGDAHLLDEQVKFYRPDLYVCCGSVVAGLSGRVPSLATGAWRETSRGIGYRRLDSGAVLISYSHPEARVASNLLFYGLIDAVAEVLFSPRPT